MNFNSSNSRKLLIALYTLLTLRKSKCCVKVPEFLALPRLLVFLRSRGHPSTSFNFFKTLAWLRPWFLFSNLLKCKNTALSAV